VTGNIISFDVSKETQSCTTFGTVSIDSRVNIELAMQLSDRLDGHIVSGHVDTVGNIISINDDGSSKRFEVEIPEEFCKYICKKGSVCIDGVSLTVNSVNSKKFSVNIIPHTLHQTLFDDYSIGSKVNIEVDLISRYLERLVQKSN
jgi:riboflavin synthase